MAELNLNCIIDDFENKDVWVQILTVLGAKIFPTEFDKLFSVDCYFIYKKKQNDYRLPVIDVSIFPANLTMDNFISEILNLLSMQKMAFYKKFNIEKLSMTEKEIFIAVYKMASRGISYLDLLEVLGYDSSVDSHTIQSHIYSIRKKTNLEIENRDGLYYIK